MRYITIEEVKLLTKDNQMSQISEDNYTLFDGIEEGVLDLIDAYISRIYNTQHEYSLKGNNRNSFLIRITLDIFIYDLFTRMSIDMMSVLRTERYERALDMLKKLSTGEMTLSIIPVEPDLDPSAVPNSSFGGNVKNNKQIF